MHCPTCVCAPAGLSTDPAAAIRTLVGEGVSTVPELSRSLTGGRVPTRAEWEHVRRIVEREVRAGRLTRTREAGWRHRIGAPPVRYALP